MHVSIFLFFIPARRLYINICSKRDITVTVWSNMWLKILLKCQFQYGRLTTLFSTGRDFLHNMRLLTRCGPRAIHK